MSCACLVGGTFDRNGGRQSRAIDDLAKGLRTRLGLQLHVHNGGKLAELHTIMTALTKYSVIMWFPNIANTEEHKFVQDIKIKHPTCILVVSKRNDNDKYGFAELMQRALAQRAALLVEFQKAGHAQSSRVLSRVLDPLGNCFSPWTAHSSEVGAALAGRIMELLQYTRVPSRKCDGPKPHRPAKLLADFCKLLHVAADRFHALVPTTGDRFLGNSSFRCQRGFPSVRCKEQIWVSRRNVDKRSITPDAFVAVEPALQQQWDDVVYYHGPDKPSVDTPIHLRLYASLPDINYMLHGHVYMQDACTTRAPIPCGAIEEAGAILAAIHPHRYDSGFVVNLYGHGFLAAAADMQDLKLVLDRLRARPAPEVV